jgi:PAS domain S-box-containing protein
MGTLRRVPLAHRGAKRPRADGRVSALDSPDESVARSADEKLADMDRRFRLFVESVKDYAIFMLDPSGRVATWNQGTERIKGYRAAEIIGQHISRFYTPEDLKLGLPAHLLKTAQAQGRVESEGWRVRADGSRFWANVVITAIRDEHGNLQGFGKVTRDLTERKQAEEALGALAGRLVHARDRERQRVAASLSDSTSPSFVALLSKLYQVRKRTDGTAAQLTDDCIALAEFLSREIRTVSYLLHPPLLETEGLLAVLRNYLEGFAREKGIPIVIDFPTQLPKLPESAEIALYRVVQEALPSLLHVSGNLRAKATLAVNHEHLALRIGDEGQGLSPQGLEEVRRGLGELGVATAGLRERMKLLGGSVQIHPTIGGTWIIATLPVNEPRLPPDGRPT